MTLDNGHQPQENIWDMIDGVYPELNGVPLDGNLTNELDEAFEEEPRLSGFMRSSKVRALLGLGAVAVGTSVLWPFVNGGNTIHQQAETESSAVANSANDPDYSIDLFKNKKIGQVEASRVEI